MLHGEGSWEMITLPNLPNLVDEPRFLLHLSHPLGAAKIELLGAF